MKEFFRKYQIQRIVLIVGVVLLFALAAVGYFFGPKEPREVEEEVKINPVFKEIPAPSLPAVSGLSFAPEFSFSTALNENSVSLPKTVKVYKIATFSATPATLQGARDIAAKFGLGGDPSDLGDGWQFKDEVNLLFVNKADLSWDLEWGAKSENIRPLSKDELIQKATAFMKERSFWKGVLEGAAVEAVGYDNKGVVLGKPADPLNPDLWVLTWMLQKDGLPIYGASDEPVVTVAITKFGEIRKVHYAVFDIEFEVVGSYPAVGFDALVKALSSGKGVIIEAVEPGRFYSSVTGQVTEFNAQQLSTLYYQDAAQGFLVPVAAVSGQAKLDSGGYVVLEVWVPGVSPEWLK